MKKPLTILTLLLSLLLSAPFPAAAERDLETGTFLQRDPAGFVDGPNLYNYVRQNPWSKFDPYGLKEEGPEGTWIKTDSDSHYVHVMGPGLNPVDRAAIEARLNDSRPQNRDQAVDRYAEVLHSYHVEELAFPILRDAYNPEAAQLRHSLAGALMMQLGDRGGLGPTLGRPGPGRGRINPGVNGTGTSNPGGNSAKTTGEESKVEVSKVIVVDQSKYPQSVQHLEEAGALNTPLTVDRAGAAARRAAALKGVPTQQGMDRDEAPPAVFKEGSQSVKPIPFSDNRGSGGTIGQQLRDVKDNETVILQKKTGEK
jgi:hypothetical protein